MIVGFTFAYCMLVWLFVEKFPRLFGEIDVS